MADRPAERFDQSKPDNPPGGADAGALVAKRAARRIWIINQYASTPQNGIGGRHHHLAAELVKLGHEVTVISARWHHLRNDKPGNPPERETGQSYRSVELDVPRYAHAHDPWRVAGWFVFAWKLARLGRKGEPRPDMIIYSSPSPIGYLGAEHLARRLKAELVFEVRDIWPLTLVELGGHSVYHPFILFLQWLENRACRTCDLAISNLRGAEAHMRDHGLAPGKFVWIPNGFSRRSFDAMTPLDVKTAAQIPRDSLIVGYAGTFGEANALESLVDAAHLLRDEPGLAFVLVGDGRLKPVLRRRIEALKPGNVILLDRIPANQIPALLQRFGICFSGTKPSHLYEYGIAANKLPEYLYSARPILHAYSGKHDPVAENGAGLTVEPGNAEAIAAAIRRLKAMTAAERAAMGSRGRAVPKPDMTMPGWRSS
ncbi:MAG: glycosyltransferase family 4 protein [Phyllobacteriaceae bacterium]|nr:glycosyltransferase family 4 protein [Phyllobacteriaceae bacterium]